MSDPDTETWEAALGLAERLDRLGMKRKTARVLATLRVLERATTQEVMRAADLTQPDVSVATQNLEAEGYIRRVKKENGEPGANPYLHVLRDDADPVSDLKREERRRHQRRMSDAVEAESRWNRIRDQATLEESLP